ncbi:hypothetical protein [Microbacterium sp. bgisy189]|uniref:hypothetical protein n=1 Tax=Microbacterium sp. bgisy189 TaxID=3413798 RepID=UPI003EC09C4D
MLKPHSRKPVAIPSFKPITARLLSGAGEIMRLRGTRRDTHRRLAHDGSESPPGPPSGSALPGQTPSTFRGTTARFIAYG